MLVLFAALKLNFIPGYLKKNLPPSSSSGGPSSANAVRVAVALEEATGKGDWDTEH